MSKKDKFFLNLKQSYYKIISYSTKGILIVQGEY